MLHVRKVKTTKKVNIRRGTPMAVAQTAPDVSRAELRRAQVLDAAAKCFNRDGFHGASMASIAQEAGLSVGQIYRYFQNKEAVIAALVELKVADWSDRMAAARARGNALEELVELARYHVEKVEGPETAALSLEFMAEAARNPKVAEIVRNIDSAMRAHLKEVLSRNRAPNVAALDLRVDVICTLIDGWPMRTVKNPDLDKEMFLDTLRPLFALLLDHTTCK
jgi:AcrR family transcriptional regulator